MYTCVQIYEHQLVGGQKFSNQLRMKLREVDLRAETAFSEEQKLMTEQFVTAVSATWPLY